MGEAGAPAPCERGFGRAFQPFPHPSRSCSHGLILQGKLGTQILHQGMVAPPPPLCSRDYSWMNWSGWPPFQDTSLVAIPTDDLPIPWQLLPASALPHRARGTGGTTVCGAATTSHIREPQKPPKMLVLRRDPFPAPATAWPVCMTRGSRAEAEHQQLTSSSPSLGHRLRHPSGFPRTGVFFLPALPQPTGLRKLPTVCAPLCLHQNLKPPSPPSPKS